MITHIVLFKLKDRSPESVAKARDALASLAGNVPTLRSIEVGTDVVHGPRSYDVAVVAKFDFVEDLEAYRVHPFHVGVGNYVASA